jgi:thioredoxin-related protein
MLKNTYQGLAMTMKNLFKIIIFSITYLIFLTSISYAQQKVDANIDLHLAYKQAQKEKKKVLLIISSSWNPWSSVLVSAIRRNTCNAILKKYYIIQFFSAMENQSHVGLETPGADEVLLKYFTANDTIPKSTRKTPCTFILEDHGKKLEQYIGFPESESGITDFGKILSKTSRISASELGLIENSLISAYTRVAPPSAAQILTQACKEAASENKAVFVIFHASWCHWCHALDTAMNESACKKIFTDNYIICHLIVKESDEKLLEENYGAEQILIKYQTNCSGIPFSEIFGNDGKPLASYCGFPSPKNVELYKDFESKLKMTSNINDQDLIVIKDAFNVVSKRNGY